jgi:hypothetical protein
MAATDLPTQTSAYNSAWQAAPTGYSAPSYDGLGASPGTVGHVWVIVLENHASEASFTPLEGTQSSYLQQLPSQGALLTHYYGTGHSSLDNYLSMFSGQAPQADDQSDCNNYSAMEGSIDTSGTPATNADFGQLKSNAGPDAPPGDNGCVYPSSVNTIFNQLQTADKSWKVYAQDLGGGTDQNGDATAPHANQDAGYTGSAYNYAYCGAPDTSIAAAPDQNGSYGSPTAGAGTSANPNFASTNNSTTDTYVAKHNPLPWFGSITGTTDTSGGTINSNLCDATSGGGETSHLGPLFGPDDQLYSDLQSSSTTPNLSVIIPNNCSNGHDALCKGNNLSGGTSDGYTDGTINAATNDTGGTVGESNFLSIVVPEIEKSPAFQQNGMIVVTYDEAYPAFTYSGTSQASSQLETADSTSVLNSIDAAGETLYGRSLNWEPTGPNATIVKSNLSGQVLSGGPGDDADVDLPNGSTATGDLVSCPVVDNFVGGWASFTTPSATNGKCVPGYQANGEHLGTSISVDMANGNSYGTTNETESGISEVYEGAQVTNAGIASSFNFPADGNNGNVYIGQVVNAPNAGDSKTAASNFTSTVNFVDNLGAPITYTGTTTPQLSLSVTQNSASSNDPFFEAYDATMGGGDAGAVVISPFVKPGTVSNTYYNHYSLLRTMEDVFGEQSGGTNSLTGGIVPGGSTGGSTGDTDGPYLGLASQPGLAPFGHDVFDVKTVNEVTQTVTSQSTVTIPGGTTTINNDHTTTVNNNNSSTVTVPGPTVTVTKIDAIVPFLKGYTLAEAKKAIKSDGLKLGAISGSGSVVSSSPAGGRQVRSGTPVSIKLKR